MSIFQNAAIFVAVFYVAAIYKEDVELEMCLILKTTKMKRKGSQVAEVVIRLTINLSGKLLIVLIFMLYVY